MEGSNKLVLSVGIVGLVLGFGSGYLYGDYTGYTRAQVDIKAAEDAIADKASEDAAKQANPFQTVNPLEGVSANPFDEAKKALNPFE